MSTCIVYNPASIDSVIAAAFSQAMSPEMIPAIQSGSLSTSDDYDTYLWVGVKPNREIFDYLEGKHHIGFFTGGTHKGRFFRSAEEKMAQRFDTYLTWENTKAEVQKLALSEDYPEEVAIPETLLSLVAYFAGRNKDCVKNQIFMAFGIASYIHEFESLKHMEIERQEIVYANYASAVRALEQDPRLFAAPGKQLHVYQPTFARDREGYMELLSKVKRAITTGAEFRSIMVDDKKRTMPVVNLPPEQSPFAARILSAVYPFGLIYDNRRGKAVYMPYSRIAGFSNSILTGMEKVLVDDRKTPQLYCQF